MSGSRFGSNKQTENPKLKRRDSGIYPTVYEPHEEKNEANTQESLWHQPSRYEVKEETKEEKNARRFHAYFEKRSALLPPLPSRPKHQQDLEDIEEENPGKKFEYIFGLKQPRMLQDVTFLKQIAEVVGKTTFWEKQGKSIFGTKVPGRIARIHTLCKILAVPTINKKISDQMILSEILELVRQKIAETTKKITDLEKELTPSAWPLRDSPKSQSISLIRLSGIRGTGGLFPLRSEKKGKQDKLDELNQYKESKQYKFYQAIEDYRVSTCPAQRIQAFTKLSQIIDAPDNNNEPLRRSFS